MTNLVFKDIYLYITISYISILHMFNITKDNL